MGIATGLHMGPIWAAPYTFMGQPRWDPCGARLHFPSGSHVGSPHGAHIGAHMGPIWVPYRLFAGLRDQYRDLPVTKPVSRHYIHYTTDTEPAINSCG
ncbi:hypothetical protein DPMN_120745 [Dreissena polymorpha]|uniref:Uncharacterized protein n=1 Tax=Dreissena polymorpha TaxID=45954 RepID=A0A9D4GPI8_DREPO|nr:hypothetical protein DPMN_120745 [Dreissena polymorpha]